MKQDWKPGTLIYPLPAVLVSCGSDESEIQYTYGGMDRNHLYQSADVLHFCSSRTSFLSYYKKEYGICDQFNNPGYGIRNRLVWSTFREGLS